ncbi:Mu transposase domain-containing protein, partial [Lacticaseibacillus suilingensis]|uniref:Mu transposase domain-containing protein n=1 Tax=Lacticaseibacillus suilingensis TaxID=2799577 RepID=UPI003A4E4E03
MESQFYSVPYEYISSKVDIKVTKDIVEVFYKGNRIASQKRLTGKFGQFSTNHDHLPAEHKLFVDHTSENALAWAEEAGIHTLAVMRYLFKSAASEKQGLSAAFRFKGLARKYAAIEIEAACTTVIKIATAPTVSVVERVLKSLEFTIEVEHQIKR